MATSLRSSVFFFRLFAAGADVDGSRSASSSSSSWQGRPEETPKRADRTRERGGEDEGCCAGQLGSVPSICGNGRLRAPSIHVDPRVKSALSGGDFEEIARIDDPNPEAPPYGPLAQVPFTTTRMSLVASTPLVHASGVWHGRLVDCGQAANQAQRPKSKSTKVRTGTGFRNKLP